MSEWLFKANSAIFQLLSISWRKQVNFQWDDDETRFILDQHAELYFYSASSLKQQSAGRHVAPLGHIILISSQSLLFLLNAACLAEKQQIPILYSLVWPDRGSNPRYTALEANTLTTTPPMRFQRNWQRRVHKKKKNKTKNTTQYIIRQKYVFLKATCIF